MPAVVPALALAWGALVFANYWPAFGLAPAEVVRAFSWQGLPVPAGMVVDAVTGHLARALVAGMVVLCLGAAGRRAGRWIGGGSGWLDAVPLGLGAFGAVILGAGLTGVMVPGVLLAAGILLVLGRPRARRARTGGPPGIPGWALVVVAAAALAALPGALAPEVTYDALAYHLGAPEAWLKLHRIVHLDRMMFSAFPLAPQMAYLLALGAGGGDGAAKLLHWGLGLGSAAAAARLGMRLAGRAGAGWAAALFAATTLVTTAMMKANVDLAVTWCAASAAFHLLRVGEGRAAALAGALTGTAAACKLTGGYAVVAAAGALLLVAPRRPRAAFLLAAAATLPLVPWLARAWLDTGDPVYPFLAPLLGSHEWTAENAAIYRRDMTGGTSFNLQYAGIASWAGWPWAMVMHDRGGEAALGPFALALGPLVLCLPGAGRRVPAARTGVRRLAGFAGLHLLLWAATARDPRFCLGAWPALCALSGAVLVAVPGGAGAVLRGACGAGIAWAPLFAAAVGFRTLNPGPVAWGAVSREAYRDRMIPPPGRYSPWAGAASALTPPGGRVLIVGDVKAVLVRPVARSQSLFDTPHLVAWLREARDAGRLAVRFRQAGIATVLYNAGGVHYLHEQFGEYALDPRQTALLRGFWASWLVPLRRLKGGPRMELLGVRARPAAVPVPPPVSGWPDR